MKFTTLCAVLIALSATHASASSDAYAPPPEAIAIDYSFVDIVFMRSATVYFSTVPVTPYPRPETTYRSLAQILEYEGLANGNEPEGFELYAAIEIARPLTIRVVGDYSEDVMMIRYVLKGNSGRIEAYIRRKTQYSDPARIFVRRRGDSWKELSHVSDDFLVHEFFASGLWDARDTGLFLQPPASATGQ